MDKLIRERLKMGGGASNAVEDGALMGALTSAMDAFPREERVQSSCLKVIRHMLPSRSSFAEGKEKELHQHGELLDHTAYSAEDGKNGEYQDELEILLSGVDGVRGMVELIVRAMGSCPQSSQVQYYAVGILTNLCEETMDPQVCNAILDAGGLIRLSEVMTFHRNLPVALQALTLHGKLAQFAIAPPKQSNLSSISTLTLDASALDFGTAL
uniref:Uncharacterized protein n=1 Tax=Entomoneis paludosa TaxID=265537 RepID=A0A7S2VAH9_9STRA|mmetsp:Transcript_14369/g.29774  ORF Transcript_14369/g.29774 Transcript_14369/m.29774 type:complete len:212 (+) Transcript_14369:162-797(+)|eukprot:CAMPEP_0172444800 /NCGR_PEP_ID=MMETSP1065-20121228/4810_1 /TAXON_ID=265537 /ORGANISM="Amphiprora paludosa, Strain CCMP125" /LENGTH=211 /DNA_ID=CAMNT_0013195495 /DNA_START=77 /DNA_END=712 /DNA_ORIENTATION=+